MDPTLTLTLSGTIALALYALLDGSDLGVGILLLIAPMQRVRDGMVQGIASGRDGNPIWLVLGAVLLWAAWPAAAARLAPALALPALLVALMLIARAAVTGIRPKVVHHRQWCDIAFGSASLIATLAQGFVLGMLVRSASGYEGIIASLVGFLGCTAALVGIYTLLGAGWLVWRTQGASQVLGRESGHAAIILALAATVLTVAWIAVMRENALGEFATWPTPLLSAAAIVMMVVLSAVAWRGLWGDSATLPYALALPLVGLGLACIVAVSWPTGGVDVALDRGGGRLSQRAEIGLLIVALVTAVVLARLYWGTQLKEFAIHPAIGADPYSHAGRRCSALRNDLHLS